LRRLPPSPRSRLYVESCWPSFGARLLTGFGQHRPSDCPDCRIDIERGKKPTFVRGRKGEADLYVRLNNSTRLLDTADALEYVSSHWR
jgi:hypothetical protein